MSKPWFITGNSRGLGLALATVVLTQGDRVVATARRPEQLHGLVPAHGDQVRCHPFDVTDPVTADQAVRFAVEEFGGIDIADSLVAIASKGFPIAM